ncbi:galactokinase [Alicyclobacillus fodiniaquatilis]|uniref:Galactokinase n=1 Tax=Alicyclobacillus fodiniaquatilis TaxID=1661150 RepID=A0ABW4JC77_9BACL
MSSSDLSALWQAFEMFSPGSKTDVRMFFAPGRVNLIGEHTDYNGGHVFPAALSLGVWAWVRPRQDGIVRFYSQAFPEVVEARVDALDSATGAEYARYPMGVIDVMQKQRSFAFAGGDFFYYSNLPNGAGLSSSAAIEVVTGCAVRVLAGENVSNQEIALISQKAENEFVGVNCGIMDQFAVAMGQANKAIFLNCQTLDHRLVPVALGDYRLVMTNTNKRRGLADSKYNERRAECEAAFARVKHLGDGWANLADIPVDMWSTVAAALADTPNLLKRARHVVFENHRTIEAVKTLSAGDLLGFGKLMNESHVSLRDDYEVTGEELDALAEASWEVDGCIGSRMTGAGFGGCTVSIVAAEQLPTFEAHVKAQYARRTGLTPSFYVSEIGDGAHELQKEAFAQ